MEMAPWVTYSANFIPERCCLFVATFCFIPFCGKCKFRIRRLLRGPSRELGNRDEDPQSHRHNRSALAEALLNHLAKRKLILGEKLGAR